MRHIALLLLGLAVAHASVTVTRTSDKTMHPSEMEIEVQLPFSTKKVRIPLNKTEAFENVPMTVLAEGTKRTFSASQAHHPSHSHYRGIESMSVISVRHVNGKRRMSGHVTHGGTTYRVDPVGDSGHQLTKSAALPDVIERQVDRKKLFKALSRKKRQSPNPVSTTYVVEINLLLDHTVWNAMKAIYNDDATTTTELHYYYTHILNGIDTVFRNIGTPSISIRCISLTVSTSQATSLWMPAPGTANADEAGVILGSMSTYSVGKVGDHLMAFTRTDIKGAGNPSVCGMAYVSGACTANRQSINEDQGLHSWGTAAHELGHNLASEHDGPSTQCAGSTNVMAPGAGIYNLGNIITSYQFSSCSIQYINSYVTGSGGSCLLSSQGTQVPELTATVQEGTRLNLDRVCKLAFPGSPGKHFLTDEAIANPAIICAKIFCTPTATSTSGTTSGGLRAPIGTPCGDKKSCNNGGQCTPDNAAPAADPNCFWGDSWDSATCGSWSGYIKYLRDMPDIDTAKSYCGQTLAGCCNSLKSLCKFQ